MFVPQLLPLLCSPTANCSLQSETPLPPLQVPTDSWGQLIVLGEGSTATVYLAELQGHFIALKVGQGAAWDAGCMLVQANGTWPVKHAGPIGPWS